MSDTTLPFKISVLVFLRNPEGRLLMIQRRKAPNLGRWSPVGGKLEMARGESPLSAPPAKSTRKPAIASKPGTCTCSATCRKKASKATGTG